MNYSEAKEKVEAGGEARRSAWPTDRKIRLATIGDYDYINYPNLDGVIVSDCPSQKCDCKICIYNPTPDDKLGEDWTIL